MAMTKHTVLTIAAATAVLTGVTSAQAITLPDSGSCPNSSPCLNITNTHATGTNAMAIIGTGRTALRGISTATYGVWGSGGSYGVFGSASTTAGVWGDGVSALGVYGTSQSNDAVKGWSTSSTKAGVYGLNTGQGYGVIGVISPAGTGTAVRGDNNSAAGWAGVFDGKVYVSGQFLNPSDARFKKNVKPLSEALSDLLKLRGVSYEWKKPEEHAGQTGTQQGFIAQEVERVFPGWVGVDEKGFKTLDARGAIPLMVESIRALKSENDALRDRVKALEERRTLTAGLGGNGLFGLALVGLGSVLVLSRRRSSRTPA
jgi:hypothetical protein